MEFSRARLGIFSAVLIFFDPLSASARTLAAESSALRAACLANAAKLTSLSMESEVNVQRLDAKGTAVGEAQDRRERVLWDKPGRRLKWSSPASDPSAYVADATAGTLLLANHAFSSTLLGLPAERAEEYTTPFPGWLWHPEWIVPAAPVAVREDGDALVVTSAEGHPRREVWLNRTNGYLERFTDTDATGALVRDVRCTGWTGSGGVWTPAAIEETLQGTEAGMRRTIRFEGLLINPLLTATSFPLL